jgi:uncharacterized protein
MKLSDGEKLIITMLADMYKHLKIKGEFDPEFIANTIYNDQLWGFRMQLSGIPFEKEENPPKVVETSNILDMWWMIETAYADLADPDRQRIEKEAAPFGKNVRFRGFDGNNEDHYRIAEYFVKDMKRFSYFAGRDLDSHTPCSADSYLQMYQVFEPMRAGLADRNLNADEIIQILRARAHPES